jgi:antitoxin FitA
MDMGSWLPFNLPQMGWDEVAALVAMCITCSYAGCMAVMVQVRNVPETLHRSLKSRAALAGMSLSDYLLGELREIAERPTLAEFRERLHTRRPVAASLDTGELVREERAAR